ncbi:glutamate decarboxylase [Microbacterium sp. Leaf288]|uniref:glutamate decarboxylase n=1 Tax=Microbacterium sp. Leaf288 TaxID=1736323 RepID=UPI0006FD1F80|nr:glutamate decarboxylase [Microbacterium sp. Leaf288]KQP68976.1 glutamate decarboxylase [Microbacterium sp. Leaf288]
MYQDEALQPTFTRAGEATTARYNVIPEGEMLPETAYRVIRDQTMLDGNARLNLATFVGTWMDDYANKLAVDSADKNMIDKDEYPATAAIEECCWRILGDLWNVPDNDDVIGTSTIGSSEACMLGGLALKRRWQHARRAAGKSTEKPNLIMSSAVQVCWEKFCNYFDVEMRLVPVTAEHPLMDGIGLEDYVDENTIGVVAIVGVTYTGAYEPVKAIAAKLDEIQEKTGLDIPMHVDGASGAMIAPFLQPDLEWDFRVERVQSINTSGHKYGLVYPGVGWVVWRNAAALPDDLVFKVSYLGGSMPTFALNFSRPGTQVLLQYFRFLRLGRAGYTAIQQASQNVAVYLSSAIAELDAFELLSDGTDIPVFAWRLKEGHTDKWTLYHLSERLRIKGWLVPAYPLSGELSDQTVMRIVCRNGLSRDLAEDLMKDIKNETEFLDSLDSPMPHPGIGPSFHH